MAVSFTMRFDPIWDRGSVQIIIIKCPRAGSDLIVLSESTECVNYVSAAGENFADLRKIADKFANCE